MQRIGFFVWIFLVFRHKSVDNFWCKYFFDSIQFYKFTLYKDALDVRKQENKFEFEKLFLCIKLLI